MSSNSDKLTITKETRLPVGIALAAIFAACSGTWYVAGLLNSIDRKLEAAIAERWSVVDMERWAYQLERINREQHPPLNVPVVPRRLSQPTKGD